MSPASTLRIFHGDNPPSDLPALPSGFDLSPRMRLPEFWEAYLLPVHLVEAKAGTKKEHRTTLKYWSLATGNPPLFKITDYTISKFRTWLAKYVYRGEPLAALTRRKHLVNLQYMLDRAGPTKSREVPTAKLLTDTFAIPKPSGDDDVLEDCFTLDEIAAYLAACQFAPYPERLPAGISRCTFWRCAGLLAYNTALRVKTLLALRWDWLHRDERDPSWWWFHVPAWAMKRHRSFRCYVNEPAMRVLNRLRGAHPERVLPWTCSEDWFHKSRRALMANSSLPEERRFGFHAFRKALATEMGSINGTAASMQLGHKTRNVRIDNYTHRRLLVEAHTRLPQPPWHGDLDGRQGLLFG